MASIRPTGIGSYPMAGYFGGDELHPYLRPFNPTFPTEMPADSIEVTLKPGSVAFLPRGTWHEARTTAQQGSLSLTLRFFPKTWLDLIAQTVIMALANDE